MYQTVAVYVALAVFGLGLVYKVSTWFRHTVGMDGRGIGVSARVAAAAKGIVLTLLSVRVFSVLKALLLDAVLQVRTLRQDIYRWFMHICIVGGFMTLLVMHALSKYTTSALFPEYQSTLNPFLFLRDFAAALMIFGLAMVAYRRFMRKYSRPSTSPMDLYAMVILGVIIVSGVLLEGVKIVSQSAFQGMVDEYVTQPDVQDRKALEAYWVNQFGMASPELKAPFDAKLLEQGKALHEMNCAQCHASPQWAFGGYAVSRIAKPVASGLDRANASAVLWHIHFWASLFGLAYLPFSKMFHVFAGPLSLAMNTVMRRGRSAPANLATKQMIELDACIHCGACTSHCSVAVAFEAVPNVNILPSEKIASLKLLAAGKKLDADQIRTIQQGMFLCTNCDRCTLACPVGINLRDLWFSARESLLELSQPEFLLLTPFSLYRGFMQESMERRQYLHPVEVTREAIVSGCNPEMLANRHQPLEPGEIVLLRKLNASLQSQSFSKCYRCSTCSNSCPVVRNYKRPAEVLGLLPHQIMHAAGLRLWDLVFASNMLWDCLGCYQCQENCPQNVCVADILYELKSLSVARAIQEPPLLKKVG